MPADKPHVLIDGTKLADAHIDGIRRYLEELLRSLNVRIARHRPDWSIRVTIDTQNSYPLHEVVEALDRSDAGTPLTILDRQLDALRHSPSKIGEKLRRFKAKMGRSVRKRWPQWLGSWQPQPQRSESQRCGLIHLPLPNTHRLYDSHPAPMMVTVHDLSHLVCPEFQTPANVATLSHGLTGAIQRGASFLAVSESTKREMVQLLDVPGDQIQVVHEASDGHRFQPVSDKSVIQRIRQKYRLPDQPFVLTLCRLEPRKNLKAVVQACHQLFQTHADLPFHLVIAGGGGWGNQADELAKLTSDRVHLTGAVADEDLAALYSTAAAFTCMSFYEGFCLPILEAMGCGCPVIHSNTSAMPEIAGNAGLSAAPTDVDQIAAHIAAVLRDSTLSRTLKAAGIARANEFSWARAADETLQMYDSILKNTANAKPPVRLRSAA